MTRSELIARLAEQYRELDRQSIERMVLAVLQEITKGLSQGGRAELRGFGSLSVRARQTRIGRNPRTGEDVTIASKRVLHFRASKDLLQKLNQTD